MYRGGLDDMKNRTIMDSGVLKREDGAGGGRRAAAVWKKRGLVFLASSLLLALGTLALYLVAANALLRTRLLRALINDGADQTFVEYGSAVSLWPGRVWVTDLRIRDRDAPSE